MTAKRNPKLTRKVQGIVTRKKQEFRDEQIVHFLIIVTCCFFLASFFRFIGYKRCLRQLVLLLLVLLLLLEQKIIFLLFWQPATSSCPVLNFLDFQIQVTLFKQPGCSVAADSRVWMMRYDEFKIVLSRLEDFSRFVFLKLSWGR